MIRAKRVDRYQDDVRSRARRWHEHDVTVIRPQARWNADRERDGADSGEDGETDTDDGMAGPAQSHVQP